MNMKGGVGKTTISANLSYAFWEGNEGLSILLVDFDPQFNLSQLLLKADEYQQQRTAGVTLWRVLEAAAPSSIFSVSYSDMSDVGSLASYTYDLKPGWEDDRLHLVPGDWELALLNIREEATTLRVARARFFDFIDKARNEYDLVVLDCNPSSSFMTRLAVEASTNILVPVVLNQYAVLGLEMIHRYVDRFPSLQVPPTLHILVNELEQGIENAVLLQQLRASEEYGARVLATSLAYSSLLQADGRVGFAVTQGRPWTEKLRDNLGKIADEYGAILGVTNG